MCVCLHWPLPRRWPPSLYCSDFRVTYSFDCDYDYDDHQPMRPHHPHLVRYDDVCSSLSCSRVAVSHNAPYATTRLRYPNSGPVRSHHFFPTLLDVAVVTSPSTLLHLAMNGTRLCPLASCPIFKHDTATATWLAVPFCPCFVGSDDKVARTTPPCDCCPSQYTHRLRCVDQPCEDERAIHHCTHRCPYVVLS